MKIKHKNGISLIVLVITIIVMIILAATVIISLSSAGIIVKAKEAGNNYSKVQVKEKVAFLLSEYIIENYTEKSISFEKYLRKNINTGVAKNHNNTYSFLVGQWQVTTTEGELISIEKFKLNVDKVYPSVADMRSDAELTEGKLVQTEGYWGSKYGGGAYYDIVNSTSFNIDDKKCIKLDNGLYAELRVINDTVNVNQFGAYGDGQHDDAIIIEYALNAGYSNVEFESKEYKISKEINIFSSDIFVFGNDAIIFYTDDMEFADDFVLRVYGIENVLTEDVTISNLHFETRDTGLNDSAIRFVKIFNANGVELTECSFITPEIDNNSTRVMSGIDCRGEYHNIDINNCDIKILTNGKAGGILWLRGGKNGTGQVEFCNNYVEKTSHDELVAIFNSSSSTNTIKDVKISGNTFLNINEGKLAISDYSSPIFTFGLNMTNVVQNIEFSNNIVDVDTKGSTFVWYDTIRNLKIQNNDIKIDYTSNVETYNCVSFGLGGNADINLDRNIIMSNNKITVNKGKGSQEVTHSFVRGATIVQNNSMTTDLITSSIFSNVYDFSNNSVNVEGNLGGSNSLDGATYFGFYKGNLQKVVNISNNNIILGEAIDNIQQAHFIYLQNCKLQNNSINILNNKITSKNDYSSQLAYSIVLNTMLDRNVIQYIYLKNNSLGSFSKTYRYNTPDIYYVVE